MSLAPALSDRGTSPMVARCNRVRAHKAGFAIFNAINSTLNFYGVTLNTEGVVITS